jgi:hypothetical protein
MGRFFRALAWAAGFLIPAVAAFYFAYVLTGNVFRDKAVPVPFERFGLAVGAAAAFFALGAVCFLRYLGRLFFNRRSQT